jgi:hypothetical protein
VAVPSGQHPGDTPRQALEAALQVKQFGRDRPNPAAGYYQEQTSGPADVIYFVHYNGRRPNYELRVGKTTDGSWYYAGEGKCLSSPFQR